MNNYQKQIYKYAKNCYRFLNKVCNANIIEPWDKFYKKIKNALQYMPLEEIKDLNMWCMYCYQNNIIFEKKEDIIK